MKFICVIICSLFAFNAHAIVDKYLYSDVHFHLTNYVQKGIKLKSVIPMMDKLGIRSMAVFGIPLQQKWNPRVDDTNEKPTYYLQTGEKLYYYSAVDSVIAMEYLELPLKQQNRFYPMITGFNPTDGYAVEHIKRMLSMFPGVFTGIGEFTIYKEVVSSKITGNPAALSDPSLNIVLKFASKSGLVVILHSDIDSMQSSTKDLSTAIYWNNIRELLEKNKKTTIIWDHTGLGRYVQPKDNHTDELEKLLMDYPNLYVDISWIETLKYIIKDKRSIKKWTNLMEKLPKRFIFGSDSVSPKFEDYKSVYESYEKLWLHLTPKTQQYIKKDNFHRIFSIANKKVRAWEKANVKDLSPRLYWPLK